MPRLLAHLLLLLYAGVFLHCQPLPTRAAATATRYGTQQQSSRNGLCKKKLQLVQANPQANYGQAAKVKLPLDLPFEGNFAAVYFGLLLPADELTTAPAWGPNAGPEQVFVNHPNKAPPLRFS
ncbi:hypothetical protein [Hymenobacter psychrophilus]|uniref:Uncharacterized protein n=1 Tax=Hymenobacter psychrophilus TaxID=651662 RepID=A0A1H3LU10_9BACT|nr:hypothetical protein [Hymenobacter psychrophilus]SDY67458.1 hypothetical protein SAMN04488069_111118 [Hymenobacter psychrophilus]